VTDKTLDFVYNGHLLRRDCYAEQADNALGEADAPPSLAVSEPIRKLLCQFCGSTFRDETCGARFLPVWR